ncbi:MarR family winged helix-turn-helix transcriptional regulator [Ferrimonas balearica]|uniref:MarR family winged helix-turn-helix transcriptional regulator n=1 Tax=Ferrimonas balearica TaxID=44012 RepID=UPI001C997CC8|nr:MarR family transcriptional regulator [Ferrimonas balearica]MBY5992713.1 MarR family transcriptional regulator [Ferrimonas balearica]
MAQDAPSLDLQQFMPYRLARLASHLSQELSQIYAQPPFEITIAEWRILAQLAQSGRLSSTALGRRTDMDKTKISRAVRLLHERGWLDKVRDKDDNRITHLSLSDSGRSLYQQLAPRALAWERQRLAVLSDAERSQLMALLDKLDDALGPSDPPRDGLGR